MVKLGGTCIVLLLHHADMGVNSIGFHPSPAGHTSEHHQWWPVSNHPRKDNLTVSTVGSY